MTSQFGLYIHIPYCVQKCPYCDFNSYAVGNSGTADEARYTSAVLAELKLHARSAEWQTRECSSIFFGGGTPSLFSAKSIGEILETIRAQFKCVADVECTLEANPGTLQEQLGADKLREFRQCGVNRISTGAQSFSARKLQALGRIHSPSDTATAVRSIVAAGFRNFNLDLIFGVQGETLEEWETDLIQALSFEPPHISAYSLTIESGTEFGRRARKGEILCADENIGADLFRLTAERLIVAGRARYEVSNFAKAGSECRHNLNYWRGNDYIGVGAGAHGFCGAQHRRWVNFPKPLHYIEAIEAGKFGIQREEDITAEQRELEYLFLRLRTVEGLNCYEFEREFHASFKERYDSPLDQFVNSGFLEMHDERIAVSETGFLFLDTILNEFVRSV